MTRSSKPIYAVLLLMTHAVPAFTAETAAWRFDVQFTADAHPKTYSGRVYIFFSRIHREPRTGPNWFHPEMFVAQDVRNWKPGQTLSFSTAATGRILAYPVPLKEMRLAGYRAQAVARFNPFDRRVGTGAGNGYSRVLTVQNLNHNSPPPRLVIDRLVPPRKFVETRWSKLLRMRSPRLSKFHNRNVFMNAAVILPAGYYDQPARRYPTIFTIPGFGGTHFSGRRSRPVAEQNARGVEFLRVVLDPSCPLGHHVFADSANNGPVGTAMIRELIPEFDRRFRSLAEPSARFLTGHSSGGWSSLWLQVTYPNRFGGTWSTSPDPVDFRDFQRINLYRSGENMYVDAQGDPRPLARRGGRVLLWYKGFAEMERVLGPGGQLHSFEAVFSPRGKDGRPRLLWDRRTGRIDARVADTWKKYDIRLVLESHWKTLGPQLAGKLHVYTGDADTFYLEGAVQLLKQTLQKLGSDAVVEIHPGRDHFTLLDRPLRDRIRREMVAAFLKTHSRYGKKR